MMYRQGDVFIQKINSKIPKDAIEVKLDNGRIVLAYGEVTGHSHAIRSSAAKLLSSGQKRYLIANKPIKLTHEEHSTIELPEGTYEVIRQREYTPEEIRYVAD